MLAPLNDILVKSHFFVFPLNRLETLRRQLGLVPFRFPEHYLRSRATTAWWALTAEICRDIADLASARGTPTLFITIPGPHQVTPEVFAEYMRGFGIDSTEVDISQPNRLLGEALAAAVGVAGRRIPLRCYDLPQEKPRITGSPGGTVHSELRGPRFDTAGLSLTDGLSRASPAFSHANVAPLQGDHTRVGTGRLNRRGAPARRAVSSSPQKVLEQTLQIEDGQHQNTASE